MCEGERSEPKQRCLSRLSIALREAWTRSTLLAVDAGTRIRDIENQRERRRAARAMIGEYHETELRKLLAHVRDGFRRLEAGEIDPFDLDDLIHHHKRSTQKLWSFCGSGGSDWEHAAITIEWIHERGEEEPDWWEAGRPRRHGREDQSSP